MNKAESKYFNTAVKMDQALIALLEEKSFDYITVSEICAKAGVNRSTFYLHYENTRDLLNEAARYLLDGFLACFPVDTEVLAQRFAQGDMRRLNYITEEYVRPYLTYILNNRRIFATVMAHTTSFEVESIFQRMFQNIFEPILSRFGYSARERNYVIRFYLNGINAIVMEWLESDCRETVEEISGVIRVCVFGREDEKSAKLRNEIMKNS